MKSVYLTNRLKKDNKVRFVNRDVWIKKRGEILPVMEPIVTILMASFNGEKYISEQIESIIDQSFENWKLVIQDDCSTDSTCIIAEKYMHRFKDRIFLIKSETPSGSAKNNFFSMLQYIDSDYFMTSDQDDIWLHDKIKITIDKMREIEALYQNTSPILIHTDVKVVDSGLNVLSDSLFDYQRLDSRRDRLNNLLVQNVVTGCTMMANLALREKVVSVPEKAIMHDWWLALIASSFGYISFINEPTVLYRQHTENAVGAKDTGSMRYILDRLSSISSIRSVLSDTYTQAKGFTDTFGEQLTEKQQEVIKAYISLPKINKIKRYKTISDYDFWKSGMLRRFGQILFT